MTQKQKEQKIRTRVQDVLTQAPLTETQRDLWRKELIKASLENSTFFLALFGREGSYGDLKSASEMMEKCLHRGGGSVPDAKEAVAEIHREYLQSALRKDAALGGL